MKDSEAREVGEALWLGLHLQQEANVLKGQYFMGRLENL